MLEITAMARMRTDAIVTGEIAFGAGARRLALLLAAIMILATGCYSVPRLPNGADYIDERTGQPVTQVPQENLDKQWPQKY